MIPLKRTGSKARSSAARNRAVLANDLDHNAGAAGLLGGGDQAIDVGDRVDRRAVDIGQDVALGQTFSPASLSPLTAVISRPLTSVSIL